ncbi:acyl-CoA dehydrogenase family protein [Streptomyces sp. NPDC005963]|uniref:acyl-CoA dehydrogenase family protein n=1 Tax=Streptomyces sp. NPDC005963 TaxID=3156721 RepID=UPI0033D24845
MRRTLFGDDHESFRAAVRQFVDRELRPRQERFIQQRSIDRSVWLKAGEQGLLGLLVPEEYGGSGAGDYRFSAVWSEELARLSVAFASSFTIHSEVVAPYLVELTTPEQRERWLPRFCSGTLLSAIGMTEPAAGSDLAALRTTAVPDGSDWILTGSKTFITNGFGADLVVVAARTGPGQRAKGITLFAVETDMPGFERGRKLDKVGQHEADTAELFFSEVRVPAANVIGEVGRGFAHMMERLPQERLGAAVTNVAHAAQILAETIDYAKERRAFGQPVGSFQYNKFRLAELVTSVQVTQAFVDQCVAAHVVGELDAVDSAKAKWWSAQVQNDVIDACVQLHGGYGYMNEYRVARAWQDARVTKIWAGSNEIMKELIGRDLGL